MTMVLLWPCHRTMHDNDDFRWRGTRVSFETSFDSKQPKLEQKLVSALSETKRLFRLFCFYTETESFDVSIEPKQQKTNRNSSIYLSSRPLIHFIPYPLILRTRFRKEISISLIQHSHATIDTCSAKRAGSNRPLTFQNTYERELYKISRCIICIYLSYH